MNTGQRKCQNIKLKRLQKKPQNRNGETHENIHNRNGKLTIMFSRFIPLLSATVPFVSGFTGYRFKDFFYYNLIGAVLWSTIWVLAGYGLGNIDWVSSHLFLSLIAITLFSFIPPISAFIFKLLKNKEATQSQ